jgi:hypothetical protein
MTMSFSPGIPQGAPTLAEVLLSRTFARPPKPFADSELLQALAADSSSSSRSEAPSPDALAKMAKSSGSYSSDGHKPDSTSGDDAASPPSSTDEPTTGRVDVRV